MTTWVEMYHPALPGTPHVRAAVQAVAEYAARGWLVVDGSTPDPVDIFLTPGVGDLRYAKTADVGNPATTTGAALRAAFGLGVASTVTTAGALVVQKHTPVDASGAAKTMTLPTGAAAGALLAVEKIDTSTNAVTVTGSIRGVGSSSIILVWAHETLLLAADASGSWWPVSGHKTKSTLDAAYGSGIHVDTFGAVGDGTTDDTAAVNAAVTAWLAVLAGGKRAALVFTPGKKYKTTSTISVVPSVAGTYNGGSIIGDGATLALTSATDNYALVLDTNGTGRGWQRPTIRGLHIDGGGLRLRSGANSEFLYDATIDRVHVTNAPESACRLSGVFETQVINSFFEIKPSVTPTTDVQSCIYIEKESGLAQPSSIDLTNVTTRGGFVGIRSPFSADVRITGGTVLAAQREGIYIQGGTRGIDGVHLEDNWLQSGATGDMAAIRLDGTGRIGTNFIIAATAASQAPYSGSTVQNYAVRVFVTASDISGATVAGTVEIARQIYQSNVSGAKTVRCTGGQSGSVLILVNCPHAEATLSAITSGSVIRLGGAATTTGGRANAVTSGPGSPAFDTTLGKPIWSNGTNWVDATGTVV